MGYLYNTPRAPSTNRMCKLKKTKQKVICYFLEKTRLGRFTKKKKNPNDITTTVYGFIQADSHDRVRDMHSYYYSYIRSVNCELDALNIIKKLNHFKLRKMKLKNRFSSAKISFIHFLKRSLMVGTL